MQPDVPLAWLKNTRKHSAKGGFSASGFTHQAKGFSTSYAQRHICYCHHWATIQLGAKQGGDAITQRDVRTEAAGDIIRSQNFVHAAPASG